MIQVLFLPIFPVITFDKLVEVFLPPMSNGIISFSSPNIVFLLVISFLSYLLSSGEVRGEICVRARFTEDCRGQASHWCLDSNPS